jgi:histone H3/H4
MGVSAAVGRCLRTTAANHGEEKRNMAAKKSAPKKKATGDLIISKSRTKAAAKKCNVGSEFYGALDQAVRGLISAAESRATGNKRKTLKAVDL